MIFVYVLMQFAIVAPLKRVMKIEGERVLGMPTM